MGNTPTAKKGNEMESEASFFPQSSQRLYITWQGILVSTKKESVCGGLFQVHGLCRCRQENRGRELQRWYKGLISGSQEEAGRTDCELRQEVKEHGRSCPGFSQSAISSPIL
ncbi:hypothetical protein XENOCAPTIV_010449 [Xenoophorus captivus]|uniref:Uncharacterized protein n=1 Tax=Xenoophorus captivus TaxID=1517983 RepID=A0ABV0QR20_9TELE